LRDVQDRLGALAGVDKTLSITDFFMEMNEAFHADDPAFRRLPETRRMVDQYLLLYGGEDMREYVNDAFDWTRVRLRLRPDGSTSVEAVLEKMRAVLREKKWSGIQWEFVGKMSDLVRSQRVMVNGQVQNILSAVLGIGVVMALMLRSIPLTLLFLLPNVFPVIINFGVMGGGGIALNTGTALIAASAFGIIVDDTVHFFIRYRERRLNGERIENALHDVTEEKGEASLSSALVLSIGFGVLMLSEFEPIYYFGLLNVVIMAVGMVGDMVLLKSLFYVGLPRRAPKAS
jgi:predicted RND superfamily exporter protein